MKTAKKIILWVVGIICTLILLALLYVGISLTHLVLHEYKPAPLETISITGEASKVPGTNETFSIMTWNIGYGALGDNADFFMDGGKQVNTANKKRVNKNLTDIANAIKEVNPDIFFLQEADVNSSRSHKINEIGFIQKEFSNYGNTYASNFNVDFLPYPLPPIGHVEAGISTFSSYKISNAERIQLPCPFTGILKAGNLKRCLLVSRVPLNNSSKELVLVNLHLEAYDSGEGKIAQTKQLKDFLQSEYDKGNYVIAGGDFNQSFSSVDLSSCPVLEGMWTPGIIEEEEFSSDWNFLMDGSKPSCRSLDKVYSTADKENFQYYIIDGFIVSKNVEVNNIETVNLNFEATDHNPVVMEVTLS